MNARAVGAAAAAVQLCRQQLNAKHDPYATSESASSHQDNCFPPYAAALSCDSVPILIAVLSLAFPSRPNARTFASLLASIGISSDNQIPYMSRDQLALIGLPSHATERLLPLVRPHPSIAAHPPPPLICPQATSIHSLKNTDRSGGPSLPYPPHCTPVSNTIPRQILLTG